METQSSTATPQREDQAQTAAATEQASATEVADQPDRCELLTNLIELLGTQEVYDDRYAEGQPVESQHLQEYLQNAGNLFPYVVGDGGAVPADRFDVAGYPFFIRQAGDMQAYITPEWGQAVMADCISTWQNWRPKTGYIFLHADSFFPYPDTFQRSKERMEETAKQTWASMEEFSAQLGESLESLSEVKDTPLHPS
jgi:hypothetical protein